MPGLIHLELLTDFFNKMGPLAPDHASMALTLAIGVEADMYGTRALSISVRPMCDRNGPAVIC